MSQLQQQMHASIYKNITKMICITLDGWQNFLTSVVPLAKLFGHFTFYGRSDKRLMTDCWTLKQGASELHITITFNPVMAKFSDTFLHLRTHFV